MTDLQIIEQLRNGKPDKPIKYLYREFAKVKHHIVQSGGNAEVAEEIFQDSLILLIEKVEQPSFVLTSKLSTYLFGVAHFLWNNEQRRINKRAEKTWDELEFFEAEDIGYNHEQEQKLQMLENVLQQLAERCRTLLKLFYFDGLSMRDIASKLNFSSEKSAKTQKYKCLETAIAMSSNQLKSLEK